LVQPNRKCFGAGFIALTIASFEAGGQLAGNGSRGFYPRLHKFLSNADVVAVNNPVPAFHAAPFVTADLHGTTCGTPARIMLRTAVPPKIVEL